MNLLEHYIKEIHFVTDITLNFERFHGYPPVEPLYVVDLTYDCYGIYTRKKVTFYKTEWEDAKAKGYFMV